MPDVCFRDSALFVQMLTKGERTPTIFRAWIHCSCFLEACGLHCSWKYFYFGTDGGWSLRQLSSLFQHFGLALEN